MKWLITMLIVTLGFFACNKNQLPQQAVAIEQVVNDQAFSFIAQTANPMGGTSVRLGAGFDLVVRKGSIVATLPYFGRSYSPVDISQGGIRFTSNRFRYNATADGKGGWEIQISPEDVPAVQDLRLLVSPDGYATLHVTNSNRQPISFYGEIRK